MVSSGFGQPKSYDRVQIPDLSVEKRRTGNTEVLDTLRLGERLRSHTLKYNFNLERPSSGHGGRLAVHPHVVAVPNLSQRDARTGGAPAGAPGGRARSQRQPARGRSGQVRAAAAPPRAAHTQGRGGTAPKSAGRPQAKTVMDFRGAGIKAPALSSSMEQLGLPTKKMPQGSPGPGGKSPNRPQTGKQPSPAAPKKVKAKKQAPPKAKKEPPKPDPKRIKKQEALRGLDQSETTVIGFDISRSVFQKPTREERKAADPVGTRTKGAYSKIKGAVSWILVIVATFFLLSYSLTMRASVSDVTRQNAELERSNSELAESVSKAQMQAALKDDLDDLKTRAAVLGLVQPDEDQIQYVDLGAPDASEDEQMQTVSSG